MTNKKIIDEWRKLIDDTEINTEPLEVEKYKKDAADYIEELLNVKLTKDQKQQIKATLQIREVDWYA